MEHALAAVGQDAFHVLQRAGHHGLAVALEHGKRDQEVALGDGLADFHADAFGLDGLVLVLLAVDDRNVVLRSDIVVAVGLEAAGRGVSDPGAFLDRDLVEAMLLQVLDDRHGDFGVGGGAAFRRDADDQVRFQDDLRVGVSDQLVQFGGFDELPCHGSRVFSIGDDDVVALLHELIIPQGPSVRKRARSLSRACP